MLLIGQQLAFSFLDTFGGWQSPHSCGIHEKNWHWTAGKARRICEPVLLSGNKNNIKCNRFCYCFLTCSRREQYCLSSNVSE